MILIVTATAFAVLAGAAGFALGDWRARHRMAQLVDVDAVRASVIDTGELELQLAVETRRAGTWRRLARWWQQVARDQAELLAARDRDPWVAGPDGIEPHRPRHLREPRVSRWRLGVAR